MSWISTPELVAAVSNAGGVGILATGPLKPDETRESIRQIRELAPGKPFGIGATLLMPGSKENATVALEEQVPIINVSLGKAEWIANELNRYGGKMLQTITNSKHAQAAIDSGADALMLTGHEAAAHGGDVTSLTLIPSLSAEFDVPLVAAGGFANGRGLAAALALGADAVAMGSRMAVTRESPLAQATKEAIVNATQDETLYGKNFDGIPARVLKTPAAESAMASRPWLPVIAYRAFQAAQTAGIPLWKVLPGLVTQFEKMYIVASFGAATESIMAATVDGDVNRGVQFIGQSCGMINDIPTVQELVDRILVESIDASNRQQSILEGYSKDNIHGIPSERTA